MISLSLLKKSGVCLLLTCFISIWTTSFMHGEPSKRDRTHQLLEIVQGLYHKTLEFQSDDSALKSQELEKGAESIVERTLLKIEDFEFLRSLALLTWIIASPGKAGEEQFDTIFFQTSHACIAKIAETYSLQNYQILQDIECSLCLDGGDSFLFREKMVKFERFLGKSPTSSLQEEQLQQESTQTFSKKSHIYTSAELQDILEQNQLEEVDANASASDTLITSNDLTANFSKRDHIQKFLSLMVELHHHAIQPNSQENTEIAFQKSITQILKNEHDSRQLGRLASAAWVLSSSKNTHVVQMNTFFYHTYRICVKKLAENPCRDTYLELEFIRQCQLCLDDEEQQFLQGEIDSVIQHLKEVGEWPVI